MRAFADPNSRGFARRTGLIYLGIAVAGAFSIAYVPSQIIVPGDALATLGNITARAGLYHAGIAADLLVMVLEIAAVAMLYFMFRTTNPTLSLVAALARLSMVGVMAAMLFFHAGAQVLAQSDIALASFSATQRAEIASLLLDMHRAGVWIWQVFFTLHLLVLGWLVIHSARFPALLGYGLMLGGVGYVLDSAYGFAFPDADWLGWLRVGFLALVTIAELGFALWLVIRAPEAPRMTQEDVA